MNYRMNFKNNTLSLGYATYMMVGSYFNECICASEFQESKFYIAYCESGAKLQYKIEEQAEIYALKHIFKNASFTPDDICDANVKVSFAYKGKGALITFTSRLFILKIYCKYQNNRCKFKHALKLKSIAPENSACKKCA